MAGLSSAPENRTDQDDAVVALVDFERRLDSVDTEEGCWEHVLVELERLLGPQLSFAVRFSPLAQADREVCSRARERKLAEVHSADVRRSDSRARLMTSEPLAPSVVAQAELLLHAALAGQARARTLRLHQERLAIIVSLLHRWVHDTTGDITALASLAELACEPGDRANLLSSYEYRQAVSSTADSAKSMLRGLAELGHAAAAVQSQADCLLSRALRSLACGSVHSDTEVRVGLAEQTVFELLRRPAQYLREQYPRTALRWSVREHIDGWAVLLTAKSAPHVRGWASVPSVPLGLGAITVNMFGGRTWANCDSAGNARSLGLTLPAV